MTPQVAPLPYHPDWQALEVGAAALHVLNQMLPACVQVQCSMPHPHLKGAVPPPEGIS